MSNKFGKRKRALQSGQHPIPVPIERNLPQSRLERAWSGFVAGLRTVLIGPDEEFSQNKFWGWIRALAIPAVFYAAGLAMMLAGPDFFWVGAFAAIIGMLLMALDLFWVTRKQGAGTKIFAALFMTTPIALIGWLVFRPALLEVTIIGESHNYDAGTIINGIPWTQNYSELEITIRNNSDLEYRGVNAFVRSDIWIVAAGPEPSVNDCKVIPENPGPNVTSITISRRDKAGVEHTERMPAQNAVMTYNRIRCEELAPHSSYTVTFALVGAMRIGKYTLPMLPSFAKGREAPRWAVVITQYEAGNRMRDSFVPKCLANACAWLPETPAQAGYVP